MSHKIRDMFKGTYDRRQWLEVLRDIFEERLDGFYPCREVSNEKVTSCVQLGDVVLDEDHSIGLFEVETRPETKIQRNRVQLRNVVAKACRDHGLDGALAVYHDAGGIEKHWRLSFVRMKSSRKDSKNRISSKRFTYLLGEDQNVRTATERFNMISINEKSLENLEQVFSVEELNKEFYKKLEKWYDKSIKTISFPRTGKSQIQKSNSVIRLITRLLFVWFIKEKGLINQDLFDISKVKNNIDYDKQSSYYKAILQNLFFATLNQTIEDRKMNEGDPRSYHYYLGSSMPLFRISDDQVKDLFLQSPFLNGGLFECHPEDGFSIEDSNRIHVPNDLFFDDRGDGLIQIFEQYRFTAEESTPLDVDVALDPELLGKVFENLLASHNPETSESARKKTGSFYTSRQVVNYIIDEALKLRLSQYDERSGWERKIVDLIDNLEEGLNGDVTENYFDDGESEKLISAIYDMKIIDPAVGSGAFPMGVLHRLVSILKIVDPKNDKWKNKNIEIAKKIPDIDLSNQKIQGIEEMFSKSNDRGDYSRKLYLIKNNIYGVDIQQIAIEIAKLRFFISLAIEQKPEQDPSNNYGITPLPNLETNLIIADTLLKINQIAKNDETMGMFGGKELDLFQKEILKIREEYFTLTDDIKKLKCRDKDNKLRENMKHCIVENPDMSEKDKEEFNKICSWLPYDKNHSAGWFDPKWMFNVERFDLVIGNPPYIQLQERTKEHRTLNSGEKYGDRYEKQGYSVFAKTGDIYQLFYERGYDLLDKQGCLCFITSNKWMRTDYGKNMRRFLGEKVGDVKILDLGADIFETATVDTNILLFSKHPDKTSIDYAILQPENKKSLDLSDIRFKQMPIPKNDDIWILLNPDERALKEKIELIGTPLKEWDISINYGIKTGYNKAFIIDKETKDVLIKNDPKSAEVIKPILRGRNIGRYKTEGIKEYLIGTHNGYRNIPRIDVENYPAIKKHLDMYYHEISIRQDQGTTPYNLRNCAYYEEFEKEKIAYSDISTSPRFYLDRKSIYFTNTAYILTGQNLTFLLGVLNSKFFTYIFKTFYAGGGLGDHGYRYFKVFLENVPIPPISSKNIKIKNKIEKYVECMIEEMDIGQNKIVDSQIDQLIYEYYDLTSEEIDLVIKIMKK